MDYRNLQKRLRCSPYVSTSVDERDNLCEFERSGGPTQLVRKGVKRPRCARTLDPRPPGWPHRAAQPSRPSHKLTVRIRKTQKGHVTKRKIILSSGFFPKELPPNFSTDEFAGFACTRNGRSTLAGYSLARSTQRAAFGTPFELAVQDGASRQLTILNPVPFEKLVTFVTSKNNLRNLLRRAHRSEISRSKPVFKVGRRALSPFHSFRTLDRERARIRAGYSWLLRTDISSFYPSVYAHSIAWSIDPTMRESSNWNKPGFAKDLEIAMTNCQGKQTHGITIGNDISFLIAEVLLSEVDRELGLSDDRALRWFDDYEVACRTQTEAERVEASLRRVLARYGLRLNPLKTRIVQLPEAITPVWRREIEECARRHLVASHPDYQSFFDCVFDIRDQHPRNPCLALALGELFRVTPQGTRDEKIAQSCIFQSIIREPGCTHKAVALLTHWKLEGTEIDEAALLRTLETTLEATAHRGHSSDVSWLLHFCGQLGTKLPRPAVDTLESFPDDTVAIQCMSLASQGLMGRRTFKSAPLIAALAAPDLNGSHWLLLYEARRLGAISKKQIALLQPHPVFDELTSKGVSFFRSSLPPYAALLTPGGAPDWLVRKILQPAPPSPQSSPAAPSPATPMLATSTAVQFDITKFTTPPIPGLTLPSGNPILEMMTRLMASRTPLASTSPIVADEPESETEDATAEYASGAEGEEDWTGYF